MVSQIQRIKSYSKDQLRLPHWHRKSNGLTIFSAYPITSKGEIIFEDTYNACIFADIRIEDDKIIRVYNMHLQSTRLGIENNKVLTKAQLNAMNTTEKLKRIVRKLRDAYKMRAQQANTLKEHIENSPHPVVLCGDMNDTPLSYVYRVLSSGLKDSFQEKGNGIGTTYAGRVPGLRIDYILVDPRFRVNDHLIMRENFSDHYPVVSEVVLR